MPLLKLMNSPLQGDPFDNFVLNVFIINKLNKK